MIFALAGYMVKYSIILKKKSGLLFGTDSASLNQF